MSEEKEVELRDPQGPVIESDDYPMRVLAGAGTGKTFTMVRKVEQMIQGGVSPDNILTLTFTNKAADSMRGKLNEKLGPDGYDVDAYTYHSVCHELLSEYAYHAGVDPGYDIVTDTERNLLILETLDEMEYRFIKPSVFDNDSVGSGVGDKLVDFVTSMKSEGITPSDLEQYLPDSEDLIGLEEMVDHIEERADDAVRVSWRKMTAERLSDDIVGGIQELSGVVEEERLALSDSGAEGDVKEYLRAMEETCSSLQRAAEKNREAILEGEVVAFHKLPAFLFGAYSSPPSGIPDIEFTLTGKLRSFIESCQEARDLTKGYQEYEEKLDENDSLDFDDLVLKTIELLEDDEIREAVSERWDYVFCDEFQDTDTIQFELVSRLVSDDRLFVVGDDDQAIYEWRGANIDNILGRIEREHPELRTENLKYNFRSRQPILDLADNLLEKLEGRGSEETLDAIEEKKDAKRGVVTLTAPEQDEEKASQVSDAVIRLLTEEGYSPGDIAVLVRKNKHAQPVMEELESLGVPYQLSGDISSESVGVETVLSYMRVLADTDDEISLNRILTMRYRLHDSDIRRLNSHDSTLEALLNVDLSDFKEPERAKKAKQDISYLLEKKETYPITRLYREIKEITNIDWYLSDQDRRDLRTVENVINDFGEGAVQPELTTDFIEFLDSHGTFSNQGVSDQSETSEDAVDVMTVHKSKGLDFPVVILPNLEKDEWSPSERNNEALSHAIGGGIPVAEDFVRRDLNEARRILHVGITRAEELCLLFGRSEEDDEDEDEVLSTEFIEDCLPDRIGWSVEEVKFPIWDDIQESLPPTAEDWTDDVGQNVEFEGRVSHEGATVEPSEAVETVLSFARLMLDDELGEIDPAEIGITVGILNGQRKPELAHTHSYTSIDTYGDCQRKYYLDNVVRAFDDPHLGSDWDSSGVSTREIGVLFHETAERAVIRDTETKDEWMSICEKLARAKGMENALTEAKDCIDRYFENEVSEWDIISAERSFSLDIDGHSVTGEIDAICNSPDGTVVLDYKATDKERDIKKDLQLPIYLLAVNEIYDEEVTEAGYVYVGSKGPKTEMRRFSKEELEEKRAEVKRILSEAEKADFLEYSSGKHCKWCSHRSLPCSLTE
jgi:DNA helicase-2/ATP-dependent DNA helicase PcrA